MLLAFKFRRTKFSFLPGRRQREEEGTITGEVSELEERSCDLDVSGDGITRGLFAIPGALAGKSDVAEESMTGGLCDAPGALTREFSVSFQE